LAVTGAVAPAGAAGSISALPGQAQQQLAIPVAPGLKPARVTGTVAATGKTAGEVRVTVQGRVLLEAPAGKTLTLDAALGAGDMTGTELLLGLEYVPAVRNVCTATDSVATLSNVSLSTEGTEKVPATVAEFLAPAVPAIMIPVPADPPRDVSAAILAATAAMAHRYPDAALKVVPDGELAGHAVGLPAGSRIISITAGTEAVSTTLATQAGRPALVLSGNGVSLSKAAQALASTSSALADGKTVTGMTMAVPAAAGPEQTLAGLGTNSIRLAGYGMQETYVGVNQSQFGGPVSNLKLHLRGTHTAIPAGGQAALSVYWNDYLLGSQSLDGDSFGLTAEVPAGQLQSRNGLRLRLAALPAGGDCTGPAGLLPMELTVDTTGSKLTGERGHSVGAGFSRFPQVLGTRLPVAFDAGASAQANTLNAAALVAALQHDAAGLLDVRLTDTGAFLDSSDSGLLVGATPETAGKVSAPMRLAGFRTVTAGDIEYGVGTSAPYAVLEAFEHNGRNLLLLGAWSPATAPEPADAKSSSAATLQARLASFVQQQKGGWSALSRNLLVTQTTGNPVLLESGAVTPQAEVTDGFRPLASWIGVAIGTLLLALGLRTWLRRRHRRTARAYADATEQARKAEPLGDH
ncbi:MAG TPA: cellulose biosynthesis cyclic di-GMP-binding regulatory protein BcsB, partial [Arthrobacter sp.]|nr:cellulose biosynthesis cyclic di-GMP-binding regulatory protein BcsB [Arthrobacter sp.]